jgi:hypothetical protein
LTKKDHLWVVVSFNVRFPDKLTGAWPYLVTSMEHKGKSYNYYAGEIKSDTTSQKWKECRFEYLTPEIRNVNDYLKIYIWNRDKEIIDVDHFKVEIFEKM